MINQSFRTVLGISCAVWAGLAESSPIPQTDEKTDYFSEASTGRVECRAEVMRHSSLPSAGSESKLLSAAAGKSTPVVDYLIFTGPAQKVSTVLNLRLSGRLYSSVVQASEGVELTSTAHLTVTVELADQTYSGAVTNTTLQLSNGARSSLVQSAGFLGGYDGNGVINLKTSALTVPVGIPVQFRLTMSEGASLGSAIRKEINGPVTIWAEADGAHVLEALVTKSAFELPDGFSVTAGIVPFQIVRSGNSMDLTWFDDNSGIVLQSTDRLNEPVRWVTEPNVTAPGRKRVQINEPGVAQRFYRLKR
jgi:hypothetical protein